MRIHKLIEIDPTSTNTILIDPFSQGFCDTLIKMFTLKIFLQVKVYIYGFLRRFSHNDKLFKNIFHNRGIFKEYCS